MAEYVHRVFAEKFDNTGKPPKGVFASTRHPGRFFFRKKPESESEEFVVPGMWILTSESGFMSQMHDDKFTILYKPMAKRGRPKKVEAAEEVPE